MDNLKHYNFKELTKDSTKLVRNKGTSPTLPDIVFSDLSVEDASTLVVTCIGKISFIPKALSNVMYEGVK